MPNYETRSVLGRFGNQSFERLAFENRWGAPAKNACLAFALGISRTVRSIFEDISGTALFTAFIFGQKEKMHQKLLTLSK